MRRQHTLTVEGRPFNREAVVRAARRAVIPQAAGRRRLSLLVSPRPHGRPQYGLPGRLWQEAVDGLVAVGLLASALAVERGGFEFEAGDGPAVVLILEDVPGE